jgi:hypothetical protein
MVPVVHTRDLEQTKIRISADIPCRYGIRSEIEDMMLIEINSELLAMPSSGIASPKSTSPCMYSYLHKIANDATHFMKQNRKGYTGREQNQKKTDHVNRELAAVLQLLET